MKTSIHSNRHQIGLIEGWGKPGIGGSKAGTIVIPGMHNDSGVDITKGGVVVLLGDGTIELADVAQDTRPIGVAIDDIDDGDTGPVQWFGPVSRINTTGSVTAGNYAETTTTAGQATENATRRAGSFGYFTGTGTNPPGFLGGVPDGDGGTTTTDDEGAYTVQVQNPMSALSLSKDGTFRDPLLLGTGELADGTIATVVNDTKYNAWPVVIRLRDGRPMMFYTKADNHNLDNTGKIVGMIGDEALDGDITWSGTEIVIADETLGCINPGALVTASGRLIVSYNEFNSPTSPVDSVRVVYSDDADSDFAGGFSAPYTVDTSYTDTVTNGTGRCLVQLSDGTVVLSVYGKNTGATYYSAAALFSTDEGETFGGQVTIANGPGDSRQYYEPTLTLVDDQKILCLLRSDPSMYQALSSDGGATWTATSLAFAGYSPGSAIQLSTRTVVAAVRDAVNADLEVFVNTVRTSWPWEWTSLGIFDTGFDELEYACPLELLNGNGGVIVYSVQPSVALTNADIKTIRFAETTTTLFHHSHGDPAELPTGSTLLTVDAGTPTYDDSGDDLVVTYASLFGYDGDGPYYDDTGADVGEEAILAIDPTTGELAVVAYNP